MDIDEDDWVRVENVHKGGKTEPSTATLALNAKDLLLDSKHLSSKQQTVLCRFISGAVVKKEVNLRDVSYIAISHVWGDTEWMNVEGIGDDIPVSQSKREFLEQHLQKLVGRSYFWIDILCVDQRSVETKIKATAVIPEIYSRALKTIVIRDGLGFKKCCAKAFGAFSACEDQYDAGVQQWTDHWRSDHGQGSLYEGILQRLWPLQEIVFSNTVKFVTCAETRDPRPFTENSFNKGVTTRSATIASLWSLATAWVSFGKTELTTHGKLGFIHALLNNEQVSRDTVGRSAFSTGIGTESEMQSHSIRKTAQARDLVLSTMSQYDWYTAPSPQWIRQKPFGVLYQDCFAQARAANRAVLPKITGGMVGEVSGAIETSNVPHPVYLGDFIKLFGLTTEAAPRDENDGALGVDYGPVSLQSIDTGSVASILQMLRESFTLSEDAWKLAGKGELSEVGTRPDDQQFRADLDEKAALPNALQVLHLMVIGFFGQPNAKLTSDCYNEILIRANPPNYARILIRLAALVSCGIGISAYEWSENLLSPVLLSRGQHRLLGLISSREEIVEGRHHLAHPLGSTMRLTYRHFVITRPGEGSLPRHRCVGLIPEFLSGNLDFPAWKARAHELGLPTTTKRARPMIKLT